MHASGAAPRNGFRQASSLARFQSGYSRGGYIQRPFLARSGSRAPSLAACGTRGGRLGRAACVAVRKTWWHLEPSSTPRASRSSSFAGRAELCPLFCRSLQAPAPSVKEQRHGFGSERHRVAKLIRSPRSSLLRGASSKPSRFGADRKAQDSILATSSSLGPRPRMRGKEG